MVSTPNSPRLSAMLGGLKKDRSSSGVTPSTRSSANLLNAEKSASRSLGQFRPQSYRNREESGALSSYLDDAISEARTREEASSEYATEPSRNFNYKSNKTQKKKGLLRRFGPLGLIVALIFGGGVFLTGAQSSLGPQLSALVTEATDVQFPSYNLRNQRLFKYLMDGGDQIKISNFTKRYTNFSPWLQKRLAKNGIEVGKIDTNGDFVASSGLANKNTVLKYNGEIITANDFQTKFAQDAGFRNSYYKSKRGRIAGFFDDAADKFYLKRGQTRDIFDQFKNSNDPEENRSNFEEIVSDHVTGTDTRVNSGGKRRNEETGEEEKFHNGDDINAGKVAGDTPEAKARAFVNNIAGKVETGGTVACSALQVANIASVAAMAYQIQQSAAYFLSFMEPVNKMMAGDDQEGAVNEALNFLTRSTTNEITYTDENGNSQTKTLTGSAMESNGAKLVMSNTAISTKDTDPFHINGITRAATAVALTTGASQTVCSGAMAAGAIVSLATTAIPGGTLAKIVIGVVAHTVGGLAITGVVSLIISAIIPKLTKLFISNVFESYTGVEAGEFFFSGAASSNFALAQHGSGAMPSSQTAVARMNYENSLAIAQEAETDRLNASPLDADNPHTFLGSIVRKTGAIAYATSFQNVFASLINSTTSSVRQILPGASAAVDTLSYTGTTQECDNLPGTVCDVYGNPIVAVDTTTVDIAPDDPTYEYIISANLDEEGEIKDDSELAKFINYCVNRESPWGVTDANILNSLQSGNVVVNNIPILNDVFDVVNALENLDNAEWATGETCVNSENNPRWNAEFKYYQRYVEDMRILGTMSDEAENPVLAYEERYEAAHPIDTSFEGTLARISGLTKNDVAFLMEVVDYSTQLAEYDPTTRYGYIAPAETNLQPIDSNQYIVYENNAVISSKPEFIKSREEVATC